MKNRINKRVEIEKYKTDFTDIGSFIKKKRKELNVTQDEISTGICSISYLSKIENNQIVPNDFYVREIMDKLNVDRDIYTKSLKDKEYIEKTIKAFFYMDDDALSNIYDEIEGVEHNLIINLCKLGYNVYFSKDDENQYVMMLENLVTNMSTYEMKVYLYFACIYFIQNERYKTALELIVLNSKISSNNNMLDAMFYEISFYVKQRLLIKNCSTEDYYNAMAIYQKYHNVKRVIYLALNKAANLVNENPRKTLKILSTIKSSELTESTKGLLYITKAEAMFKLNKNNEATLALKHIKEHSKYYLRKMTLLLRICLEEEDYDMIKSIKEIVARYKPKKSEMRSKVYYHFLIQESGNDKKEYLRDIAIPFSIKIEDFDYLSKYIDNVMSICVDSSRYKEAMQYYKKHQKELNKVRKILY